ncbi:Hypothetical predicted protein [Podarcis lilfordi]|uniref:Uncharacterized protein n=1 Tax=Podarcis lilfordi TaxID=74358 RepID=A0AA35JM24_9SAUR|nr:Hypothetical predicted protein [Podarcis lilfordi]
MGNGICPTESRVALQCDGCRSISSSGSQQRHTSSVLKQQQDERKEKEAMYGRFPLQHSKL